MVIMGSTLEIRGLQLEKTKTQHSPLQWSQSSCSQWQSETVFPPPLPEHKDRRIRIKKNVKELQYCHQLLQNEG